MLTAGIGVLWMTIKNNLDFVLFDNRDVVSLGGSTAAHKLFYLSWKAIDIGKLL